MFATSNAEKIRTFRPPFDIAVSFFLYERKAYLYIISNYVNIATKKINKNDKFDVFYYDERIR
jgi:hypothetical protein